MLVNYPATSSSIVQLSQKPSLGEGNKPLPAEIIRNALISFRHVHTQKEFSISCQFNPTEDCYLIFVKTMHANLHNFVVGSNCETEVFTYTTEQLRDLAKRITLPDKYKPIKINEEKANEILKDASVGTFLIRPSTIEKGQIYAVLKTDKGIIHTKINAWQADEVIKKEAGYITQITLKILQEQEIEAEIKKFEYTKHLHPAAADELLFSLCVENKSYLIRSSTDGQQIICWKSKNGLYKELMCPENMLKCVLVDLKNRGIIGEPITQQKAQVVLKSDKDLLKTLLRLKLPGNSQNAQMIKDAFGLDSSTLESLCKTN